VSVSYLDLTTNVLTPVPIAAPTFPNFFLAPINGGRIIANDGTAILGVTDGSGHNSGYILKPGSQPKAFPVENGLPLIISDDAAKVVYQSQGIRLLDVGTLQSTLLIPADEPASGLRMSGDAGSLLYLNDGRVRLVNTATLAKRVLTGDPAGIKEAAISGTGKIVYAVTGQGRLLKLDTVDGSQSEVIGRTPYLDAYAPVNATPGFATILTGGGLADFELDGRPPLAPYLGNVTMWIGERKVPMVRLTPNTVRFLVPWDQEPGAVRLLAEVPGDNTPFGFPELDAVVSSLQQPAAGALARQDWTQTYSGPVNTGEIIHVWASGFGPVSPEVSSGAQAPSAEPLSRIIRPLKCSNAEVLYAGLAPGAVERVYQIDLRIGPIPGYQRFTCTLSGSEPFVFLTLNVVP
jgi:uncharacterized protein (TIGR03437 family)